MTKIDIAIKYTLFFVAVTVLCYALNMVVLGFTFWGLIKLLITVVVVCPCFAVGCAEDATQTIWKAIYNKFSITLIGKNMKYVLVKDSEATVVDNLVSFDVNASKAFLETPKAVNVVEGISVYPTGDPDYAGERYHIISMEKDTLWSACSKSFIKEEHTWVECSKEDLIDLFKKSLAE